MRRQKAALTLARRIILEVASVNHIVRAKKKLLLKSRPVPRTCAMYTLSGNTRYYGLNRTVGSKYSFLPYPRLDI
jgi:hypothetical protein